MSPTTSAARSSALASAELYPDKRPLRTGGRRHQPLRQLLARRRGQPCFRRDRRQTVHRNRPRPRPRDLYVDHRTSIAVYNAPVEPGEAPLEIDRRRLARSTATGWRSPRSRPPRPGRRRRRRQQHGQGLRPEVSLTVPVRDIDGAGTAAGASSLSTTPAWHSTRATATCSSPTTPSRASNIRSRRSASSTQKASTAASSKKRSSTANRWGSPRRIPDADQRPGLRHQRQRLNIVVPPEGPSCLRTGRALPSAPPGRDRSWKRRSPARVRGRSRAPAGIACPAACEAEINSGASSP